MMKRWSRFLLPMLVFAFVAACGGGGGGSGQQPGGGDPPPPPPPPPPEPTSIALTSDAGDYIGGGRSYSYTQADSLISVTVNGARLDLSVSGDESWSGTFELPNTYSQFEAGVFTNLERHSFHDPAVGGLSWTGEGRGCNTSTGVLTINEVTYEAGVLTEIDFEFEQYCESGPNALRGDIHWNANDATSPPGPMVSPPAGLWEPAAGTTPDSGNFIYLESAPGDWVGQGGTYLYTQADSFLTVSTGNGRLSVSVDGNERWNGDFQAMSVINFIEAGYYGDLRRYPFHNPVKGGLSWSGEGRGCNQLTGWFMVDSVTYTGDSLETVELRFQQRCDGGPPLHGAIRWDVNDTTAPPGPVLPPAGLWEPEAGATPETGNFVYLDSDAGDYIGQGGSYLYTPADAVLSANSADAYFQVYVDGDENWHGRFQGMSSISRLEVGYYDDLQRYPFHNPVKGGLSWSGEGRGCNTLTGWFVVDSVTYDGSNLQAIEMRFEQHCEGGGAALNGAIRWDANDTTAAPGPVVPPPAGLWAPPAGATPASGNFVYMESTPGDWVGQGFTYLYTSSDSLFTVGSAGAHMDVGITGDENWRGDFVGMNSISQLEVGYYGDLQRYPFHNPVKGGLSWSGEGRGCNQLTGWFVIDNITYNGNALEVIDLRFEQRCDGGPPLHGAIRWDVNDTTSVPGPVVPPPAGLWEPPAGVTPETGNYVYLESDFGDWVGGGQNYLYTQADAILDVTSNGARLDVSIRGDEDWGGTFQGMLSISRLEVGYYGDLRRYPFHNPVKGGLSWTGEGRGCNELTGWFVIDNVTYDGNTLTAIDLRFQQNCDGGPPLHGEIHWDASDTTTAPGPVNPPPTGLWEPPASVIPATGNYVYLESDIGDYIGQGQNYLYDDTDGINIDAPGAALTVSVDGWNGRFQAMNSLNYLEVGYYGDLERYPFHNPVKGGLSWTGNGRGCNTLSGWFVIDSLTYTGIDLTAIELRFEQRCDGGPPLNGSIRWSQ